MLLAACGSAPTARGPRVVTIRARAEPTPVAVPLAPRLERAREDAGPELVAEHRAELDGEARIHLVLERGLCYRVWVGADGVLAAELVDEHGHEVARGEAGWLTEVCPEWSGSFELVLAPGADARSAAVLVAARALDAL